MQNEHKTLRLAASPAGVAQAAAMLRAGGTVAVPTETVYGLAADALNPAAVERIFVAKQRPHWDPLIVHVVGDAMLQRVALVQADAARRLIAAFWPGPLTLLLPRQPEVPDMVTAGRPLVAVRAPAHPVAMALITAAATPLAAPSANRFGHVSPTSPAHVLADLDGRIDAVLDGGTCAIGVESTVVEPREDRLILYRAGAISAAALEKTTGLTVEIYTAPNSAESTTAPESLPSPGVGIRHYATRARVVLVHSQVDLQARARNLPAAAVLLPAGWALPGHTGPVFPWAAWDDADAMAATLYEGLRAMDATGAPAILVPMPPRQDGLFAALHDRLEKAARPA